MYAMVIKYSGATPDVAKSEFARIKRVAYLQVGEYWHKNFRPKHFTVKGAREYGYQKREGERGTAGSEKFKTSYTGRKLRRFGHTRPLVLTGESMRLAAIRDVRSTSKGAKVVIHARVLNFRPHMRREMTMISLKERDRMVKFLDLLIDRMLKGIKRHRTVKG